MWTPKSEAGPQFDPRGSGFLCVCTHGCLSNPRWHHPPFITGRGVGPCHLLSSLSTRPQRRKEEQEREGDREAGGKHRHRYGLVKLKHYVRHGRLLSHPIWHMFLSNELLSSQQFVSATILQGDSLLNTSILKRSLQDVCTISCLIVNLMKGGKSFICNVEPWLCRAQHLSALIQYSYLFMWQAESCTNSEWSWTALPLPPINIHQRQPNAGNSWSYIN